VIVLHIFALGWGLLGSWVLMLRILLTLLMVMLTLRQVLDGIAVDADEIGASKDAYSGRLTAELLEEKIGSATVTRRRCDRPSLVSNHSSFDAQDTTVSKPFASWTCLPAAFERSRRYSASCACHAALAAGADADAAHVPLVCRRCAADVPFAVPTRSAASRS
jgi:hypothetical protein